MPLTILLVEDNPADVDLLAESLDDAAWEIIHVERLRDALHYLNQNPEVDVILLDLSLPDSQGLDIIPPIHIAAPNTPIVVLTGTDDTQLAVQAVSKGAQDYLVKGQITSQLLTRAIHYAIERTQALKQLQESDRRFRAVFNQTFQFMALLSPDGVILEVNQALDNIKGFRLGEMINCLKWEVDHCNYSKDMQQWMKNAIASAAQGQIVREEVMVRDDHQEPIWLDFSLKPMKDAAGQVISLIVESRDISDRKRIEADLAESEAKFRHLVEGANDLIWSSDEEGQLTYLSPQFKVLFGWQPEAWLGRSVMHLIHPDDLTSSRVYIEQVLTLGKNVEEFEFRHLCQDGHYVWVLTSATPVKHQGKVIGAQGILRDISDRKQAEAALKVSEHRYLTLAAAAPVGIFRTNANGHYLYVNERWCEISGLTLAEAADTGWTTALHSEDQARISTEWYRCAQTGEQFSSEYRFQRQDGKVTWVFGQSVQERDENGAIAGYVGTITDISDRKQAEVRLEQQAEQERQLSAITQRLRSSLHLEEILNITVEEVRQVLQADRVLIYQVLPGGTGAALAESVAPPWTKVLNLSFLPGVFPEEHHPHYLQGWIYNLSDCQTEPVLPYLAEFFQTLQVRAKLVVPIVQNEKLWGLLITHQCERPRQWQEWEIDWLRQLSNQLSIAIQQSELYAQLQDSNCQLARATRLKDEFLANMSHELRTPLNAILGLSEVMQEQVYGDINEKQRQALQTIHSSGTHLLELINDILDLAKIEAGQVELNLAPTAIHTLCQASLSFVKQQAFQKGIQLEMNIQPHLPDLLLDERRIRQVLINLLSNAVKFTPECGHITLEVSQAQRVPPADSPAAAPQDVLQIAVIDTGIGIAPENLNKLFQPFIQIDSALNRQYEGSGLGLALVKRIVELHGGSIEVFSHKSMGSRFTVVLPLVTLPSSAQPLVQSSLDAAASFSETREPTRRMPLILLAENNEANIATLSSYLTAKGYGILLAKNGREAIALTQQHSPDLILMDIQMPEVDGLEAIRQIRSQPDTARMPIISLTALVMPGDREQCLAAGANAYLSKPIKLKQLLTTIQQLLATQTLA
ncbi:MAG TPA: PAS domain S-box protein [Coleofasciculaceae cyanobacterium]